MFAVAQLKKAKAWGKGMPWRTAPHFSTTRRTREAERGRVRAWEKDKERDGMERLGLGLGLGFGSGFLRWWSLMRE